MTKRRPTLCIVHCAFCIAFAALCAANADTYQYILTPNYNPAIASQSDCMSTASSAIAIETGALTTETPAFALEARFRTWLEAILGTKFSSYKALGTFILLR